MQKRGWIRNASMAGLSALLLSACVDQPPSSTPTPRPDARAIAPATSPQNVPTAARSARSVELQSYYARVQQGLLSNGLLRTERAPPDAPFGARQLAENFDSVALNDEYTSVGGQYVALTTPSALHKWDVPVRLGIEFGPSVPVQTRIEDRQTLSLLSGELSRASGHSVSLSARPNFHVLVLNEDEIAAAGPRLQQLMPEIGAAALRSVANLPQTTYCVVIASDPGDRGAYRRAVAIIRAEHPALLRRSCLHEEVAQGMGLANDSPRARPSIFNDDEEFALLTAHDALLLRMLYDPRLTPGMSPETARPIATTIAYELTGEAI